MKTVEKLQWNEGEVLTSSDLYEAAEWPRIVKVDEGYYGPSDCQTFSHGDPLVVLGHKCFLRIGACGYEASAHLFDKVTNSENTSLQVLTEELAPTVYLSVTQPSTVQILPIRGYDYVYETVNDLLEAFPRFVRVNRPFSVHHRGPMVRKGDTLELLRTESGRGAAIPGIEVSKYLMCSFEGRTVALGMDTRGDFTIEADENYYPLSYVVERLPFPQRVSFDQTPNVKDLKTGDVLLCSQSKWDVLIAVPFYNAGEDIKLGDDTSPETGVSSVSTPVNFLYFPLTNSEDYLTFYVATNVDSDVYVATVKKASRYKIENFKYPGEECTSMGMHSVHKFSEEAAYRNVKVRPPLVLPKPTGLKDRKSGPLPLKKPKEEPNEDPYDDTLLEPSMPMQKPEVGEENTEKDMQTKQDTITECPESKISTLPALPQPVSSQAKGKVKTVTLPLDSNYTKARNVVSAFANKLLTSKRGASDSSSSQNEITDKDNQRSHGTRMPVPVSMEKELPCNDLGDEYDYPQVLCTHSTTGAPSLTEVNTSKTHPSDKRINPNTGRPVSDPSTEQNGDENSPNDEYDYPDGDAWTNGNGNKPKIIPSQTAGGGGSVSCVEHSRKRHSKPTSTCTPKAMELQKHSKDLQPGELDNLTNSIDLKVKVDKKGDGGSSCTSPVNRYDYPKTLRITPMVPTANLSKMNTVKTHPIDNRMNPGHVTPLADPSMEKTGNRSSEGTVGEESEYLVCDAWINGKENEPKITANETSGGGGNATHGESPNQSNSDEEYDYPGKLWTNPTGPTPSLTKLKKNSDKVAKNSPYEDYDFSKGDAQMKENGNKSKLAPIRNKGAGGNAKNSKNSRHWFCKSVLTKKTKRSNSTPAAVVLPTSSKNKQSGELENPSHSVEVKVKVSETRKGISDLGIDELADLLEKFNLIRFAPLFLEARVDGAFFLQLSDEDFKGQPFSASPFEIKQLLRIQSGNIPRFI